MSAGAGGPIVVYDGAKLNESVERFGRAVALLNKAADAATDPEELTAMLEEVADGVLGALAKLSRASWVPPHCSACGRESAEQHEVCP